MALFLVIGSAGTGKSTLCLELKRHGYAAYDIDDDALARWQHKQYGHIHPKSSVKPHQRTPEFLAAHDWNVPREMVERLMAEAGEKPLFILGAVSNLEELQTMAAGTFALYVDGEEVARRLHDRPGERQWGKQPHEVEQTLRQHAIALKDYKQRDIVVINSSQPLEAVADELIRLATEL